MVPRLADNLCRREAEQVCNTVKKRNLCENFALYNQTKKAKSFGILIWIDSTVEPYLKVTQFI